MSVEPGVELFREGQPADFWWVLVDGAVDLIRRVGREETVVARMDVPGRWAGGFRAWDEHGVYLATGRGVRPGRVLRVPAEVLRDRANAWFPFGGHLIAGLYRTARSIESTARQRESLVTLGTLAAGLAHEINNPASAATRAVDGLEAAYQSLLSALGRLAAGRYLGRAVRRTGRAAARDRAPSGRPGPARARRPRAGPVLLARRPRGRASVAIAPRWPLPVLTLDGASGLPACSKDQVSSPALEWVASTLVGDHAAGRGQGVDAADLRTGRRRPVVLADGPGVTAADRRDRGSRHHAGGAQSQASATA